jgi:hypothetical protein
MSVLRRLALATTAFVLVLACAAQARTVRISEYRLSDARLDTLRDHWVDQLLARHSVGTWAPMKFTLTDADLRAMGLPPKRVLLAHHYRRPTVVRPDGRMWTLGAKAKRKGGGHGGGGSNNTASGGTISYAGAGFFGIRPGAWLLTVTDKEIGWCSMAHVYGSPGAYQISTAGHCGKVGDTATVIGAVGDHQVGGTPVPVLLDFGKYTSSTGDAGIGKDWALISVDPEDQALVSPTMAFWGGPKGMFTSVGEVASINLSGNQPQISTNPNPALAQQILHYGHGAGIGAGGTPRTGTSISWQADHFSFFGAITPGDSGSGSNTLLGDAPGDEREAAGINTPIYVDPTLKTGLGYLAGTRATQVHATLADGQLIPYPVPAPGAP